MERDRDLNPQGKLWLLCSPLNVIAYFDTNTVVLVKCK